MELQEGDIKHVHTLAYTETCVCLCQVVQCLDNLQAPQLMMIELEEEEEEVEGRHHNQ